MEFKLRGTNVIAIELIADNINFNVERIKQFISEKKQLLKGSRFVISIEDYVLTEAELDSLINFLKQTEEITFCGFKTNKKENRELCIKKGIPCDMSSMELEKLKERSPTEEIKFIRKTLRSGDKISSSGDIVIMGNVNPGAEVEAGGNVYVMGDLRGTVKAGIGKTEGEVKALFFQAPRLEICGKEFTFDRKEKYLNFKAKVKGNQQSINYYKDRKGKNG
ncbi:septum site-determining protein MinC [Desulfurobacterium pacificum]|uniref:Probable septum site-determining protein MinC n=1 Tax=Desulfurobacterium pacificum TaxID=240166 RepID=A0ABY1NHX3_9BACT|nr:septum site-determining protein MinC [Desulfurobacterium pacificum]SMP09327.1 septum site-determining protein MinC [Desulfurobacterium pacificum]